MIHEKRAHETKKTLLKEYTFKSAQYAINNDFPQPSLLLLCDGWFLSDGQGVHRLSTT